MLEEKSWLGDDNADLAPFARAGWGVLLMHGKGSWPTNPSVVSDELERAIPAHGVALWGYPLQVHEAHNWLEPELAIAMAHAFRSVSRHGGLRIRVSKSVWQQQDVPMSNIITDLADVVGLERIFAEWPGRAAVPKPDVDRDSAHSLVVGDPGNLLREFAKPEGALPSVVQRRDAFSTDLYLIPSEQARKPVPWTVVAVLVGTDANDALDNLLRSREEHRARCLVHVPVAAERSGSWFKAFLSAWNQGDTRIDDALKAANSETNLAARIVASTQTFILESSRFLKGDLDNGIHESSMVPDFGVPRRVSPVDALGLLSPKQDAQTRVLDARVMHRKRLTRRLPKEGEIDILIDVRPKSELDGERESFPDNRVQWNKQVKTFQVHMLELGRKPVTSELDVPREGVSDIARFRYVLQSGTVDLRFIVSDGQCILQTARLQGEAGGFFRFTVESIAAPISPRQRPFDLALLVNDSLGGEPSLTTLTPAGIELAPLTGTQADTTRSEMLEILETAVVDPKISTAEVLLTLAGRGKRLLRYLRQHVNGWPEEMTRIQLTTQSDAFFPLEYLYDGPIPDNGTHGICSQSKGCLSQGQAISGCTIRAEARQLCPMGFLGLTAVIERHTWRKGHAPGIWLASPEALESRQRVTDLSRVLFSASAEADKFPKQKVASEPKYVHTDEIVDALQCSRPQSWSEWRACIADDHPSLLVLVMHIDNDRLHLGDSDRLLYTSIDERYIGDQQPIVIAIGCSSGQAKMVGADLPAVLKDEGASVVVAAMTDVLGRHANRAALELALAFRAAVSPPNRGVVSIGELMTKLRRDLLADGVALGLAFVAYGDADVALVPTPQD